MCPQWMAGSVFREQWGHFFPEFIANLPLVAYHTSPSENTVAHYIPIPFGMGSKLIACNIYFIVLKYYCHKLVIIVGHFIVGRLFSGITQKNIYLDNIVNFVY